MKALVVIPTKNPMPEDFREQLDVLLNQDFEDFKILYLNSGSNWIEEELASIESDKVIYQEVVPEEFNHGLTRNMALNFVTEETQYLAYLTHDSIPLTISWLSSLIEPMQKDSLCAFTFGRQHLLENANYFEKQDMIRHFDNLESTGSAVLGSLRWHKERVSYRQRLHFNSNANAAYRLNYLTQKGFPDADFGEDQLIANTFTSIGLRGYYALRAGVTHDNRLNGLNLLTRSFDESRFFSKVFGYKLGLWGSLSLAAKRTVNTVSPKNLHLLLQALHHLGRKFIAVAGVYLGRHDLLARNMAAFISRDRRMKRQKY